MAAAPKIGTPDVAPQASAPKPAPAASKPKSVSEPVIANKPEPSAAPISVVPEFEKEKRNNGKWLWIILVILIVILVLWWLFMNKTSDPQLEADAEVTEQITVPTDETIENPTDEVTAEPGDATTGKSALPTEATENTAQGQDAGQTDPVTTTSAQAESTPAPATSTPSATAANSAAVTAGNSTSASNVSNDIEAEAMKVIRGVYGDGQTRKQKLGERYTAIQKRVNEMTREGLF